MLGADGTRPHDAKMQCLAAVATKPAAIIEVVPVRSYRSCVV